MKDNIEFLSNLSRVLAHSVVYEHKSCVELYACGPDAPNIADAIKMNKESIQTLIANLPEYYSQAAKGAGQMADVTYGKQIQYAPQFADIQSGIYKKQAPGLSDTANKIAAANAQAYLESALKGLGGTGRQVTLEADKTQRMLDPEYYALREAIGKKTLEQIQNPVTGGEREALQRGINAQNKGYMPTNLNTVAAAQSYGGQYASRLDAALNRALGALPGVKSGQDAFKQATGAEGRSNAQSGYNAAIPTNEAGGISANLAGSLLGAGTQGQASMNNYFGNYLGLQTANDPLNRFGMSMSGALGGMLGSKS